MSWLSTIFTALFTASLGSVVSGYFANLSVRWYRISSFEGGSGYYVVGLALCGLVAGLIIGLVIARVIAASAHPSVAMALLYSTVAILSVTSIAGGAARLLADIPPTLDGEALMLQVEARWPTTRVESPANTPGVAHLDLGSTTLVRRPPGKRGALWKEDAQQIDGRWTVIGAVPLFTSRGTPTIEIALDSSEHVAFTLPSLAHPTAEDSAWTAWYPTEGKGGLARTVDVTYRYRVQKQSVPVRTEHIGDFSVSATVSYFKPVETDDLSTLDFYGTFRMALRGTPLTFGSTARQNSTDGVAEMVAVLPGTHTALLAVAAGSYWMLTLDETGTLRQQRIADYSSNSTPAELTNVPERMAEMRHARDPRGRVDRSTYTRSRMLLFDHAVLDVDARQVHPFTVQSTASLIPSVPPLGVSPNGHCFVRFVMGAVTSSNEFPPMLAVTDFIRDMVYELPIDRARMPYGDLDDLDAKWLARYFTWKRDADGVERLVPATM